MFLVLKSNVLGLELKKFYEEFLVIDKLFTKKACSGISSLGYILVVFLNTLPHQ